jgi:hypothetical protein
MLDPIAKPLIKKKLFVVTLVLAIACSLASFVLFGVIIAHIDSCITFFQCYDDGGTGYDRFCVEDGYKFCCGGSNPSFMESCGSYYHSCKRYGSGFISNCGDLF